MGEWKLAKADTLNYVDDLRAIFPKYSYSNKAHSIATDEVVCAHVVGQLHKAKALLFQCIDRIYNSGGYTREFESKLRMLRDDMDIFSDEIKVRLCKWEGLDEARLSSMVKKDAMLVKLCSRLNSKAEGLLAITNSEVNLKAAEQRAVEVGKALEEIVVEFKEREAVCK